MRARVSEARGRWFDSSRSLQIFDIRGLGKRINPLGLGPRESRFKSEVPDQVLWGSQVVRRLAVNQFMRRFESCPHSQYAGVAFWLRAPLLQRGAVEFDPLPRYQHFELTTRLWPRGFRHRSSKAIHLVRVQPGVPCRGRSMAGRRSLEPSTLVRFQPSVPRLCWRGVRCTGGLINRFAPDQSMDWVRLPAPAPCVRSS
jgi:hypothetical protein